MMKRKLLAAAILTGAIILVALPASAGGYGWTTTTTEATTSTTDQEVTTTVQETTTTLPEMTTTTSSSSSTTTPNVAVWDASATCETVSVSFDVGIVRIDAAMLDGVPGTDELVGDLESPFFESGSQWLKVGTPTLFRLTPVPAEGFTVNPEFRDVTVGVCEETTTTTMGPTTTVPDSSTLPFTGLSETMWATLVFAGAVAGILGFMVVMSSRDDE
jgi:hypothetical protein